MFGLPGTVQRPLELELLGCDVNDRAWLPGTDRIAKFNAVFALCNVIIAGIMVFVAVQANNTADAVARIEKRRDDAEFAELSIRSFVLTYYDSPCNNLSTMARFPLEKWFNWSVQDRVYKLSRRAENRWFPALRADYNDSDSIIRAIRRSSVAGGNALDDGYAIDFDHLNIATSEEQVLEQCGVTSSRDLRQAVPTEFLVVSPEQIGEDGTRMGNGARFRVVVRLGVAKSGSKIGSESVDQVVIQRYGPDWKLVSRDGYTPHAELAG